MIVEHLFDRHHAGLHFAWRSLIDGAEFPFSDKQSEDAQRQACKEHVAALIQEQDGDVYRELPLATRQAMFRHAQQEG